MSEPVTLAYIGAALFVASEVGEKQGWFDEDFAKVMKIGGAALAVYGVGAQMAAASAAETGAASAVGTSGAGATTAPVGGSVAGIGDVGLTLAEPAATGMGATEMAIGSKGLESAAAANAIGGEVAAGLPAAAPTTSAATAADTGLLTTEQVVGTKGMAQPAAQYGAQVGTEEVEKTMWERLLDNPNAALVGGMVGGQALTGYMGSKQQEAQLREKRDRYNRESQFGVDNTGRVVDLGLNRALAATSGLLTNDELGRE